MHSTMLEHWDRGLAAYSGETVAAHWVEVLAAEASTSGSSAIVLESLIVVSRTECAALVLASVAGSSMVA
jgi:hypothetical protein